jgi:hypothetical protein
LSFGHGQSLFPLLLCFLVPSKLLTEVYIVERIVNGAVHAQLRDLTSLFLSFGTLLFSLTSLTLLRVLVFTSGRDLFNKCELSPE